MENWQEELEMFSKITGGNMITYELNKKVYFCDHCEEEVYSLICRRIDGEDYDICDTCFEEETGK